MRSKVDSPHSQSEPQVAVTIYRITGKQLFFHVNQSVCEECDMTVAAVQRALGNLKSVNVNFRVKAWLNNLPMALLRGGYHPPVLLVDGKVISQGVVPREDDVKRAVLRAWEEKLGARGMEVLRENSQSEALQTWNELSPDSYGEEARR